jgi:NAD(P)-dependent dehydrogenase (short-subunit alcohol dehydrogenase family)
LRANGVNKVDGVLADLGISSHQIDSPGRGFSTRFDGPLDMRMDQHNPLSAAKLLNESAEESLHKTFGMYGEVKNAKTLAKLIVQERSRRKFDVIADLIGLLKTVAPKGKEFMYYAQVFQALRIEVNQEMQVLEDFLMQCADVMNEEQLIAAKDKVLKEYGKIDGLVNGAGGNVPEAIVQPDQDVFSLQLNGMKKAMEVNLWGTVSPTLIFGKAIAENGGGSIVNISSVSAERTLTKVLGYSLGKAAVDSFTKWFAVEMAKRHGDKIRMNSIMPGFFLTEQNRTLLTDGKGGYSERGGSVINHTPFNRFGDPEDLDGALVWLLSDASKFVTGTKVTVDGGFNAICGV